MKNVDCLIGGQYGSEGKGVVAVALADEYSHFVRVGGPNAGHSFVHEGVLWKMQSIPCGWVNKNANLYLGPAAMVRLPQLMKEIEDIERVCPSHSVMDRLHIHPMATIIQDRHVEEEGHTEGEIHRRIGSTGEGIGAARRDRMSRQALLHKTAGDLPELSRFLNPVMPFRSGEVMLEGTQGWGLSLTHGLWPYVTSHDTGASQLLADCGYGPKSCNQIIMVFRSYPIRVAGNSGPMSKETTWEALSEKLGKEVVERTTVTKKIRRVAEWDWSLFHGAVRANTPTALVLTFADYMDPACQGATRWSELSEPVKNHVREMEGATLTPVVMIGTGFDEKKGWTYVDRR